MQDWPWFIFVVLLGGCVGSFLNVVIYRLPAGVSLVTPPSRCPDCGHRLAWYDNVPVLGWLWLGGRCRYCGVGISLQYPVVEAITAMLFAGVYWGFYYSGWRPEFAEAGGVAGTWPMLVCSLVMVGGLLVATVIDARLYVIPLSIPWLTALVAMIVLPAGAWWTAESAQVATVAGVGWWGSVWGAALGLAISVIAVRLGWIKRSFEYELDEAAVGSADQISSSTVREERSSSISKIRKKSAATAADRRRWVGGSVVILLVILVSGLLVGWAGDGGVLGAISVLWLGVLLVGIMGGDAQTSAQVEQEITSYPHARREVLRECLFLAWPVVGAVLGGMLPVKTWLESSLGDSMVVQVLTGAMLGFLVGGAIVWLTRIVGTLAFGREAMGLGDVHLLAGIGAVLGPVDVVLAFLVAPFMGLTFTLVSVVMSRVWRRSVRVVPYGPYLAGAAVLLLILRHPLRQFFGLN